MQTTDHIKCTISIELEKQFLDSIENEDEKSLDEFRQLMENSEIIHHIAIMPKTAKVAVDVRFRDYWTNWNWIGNAFSWAAVKEAVPLYVALASGNVEKVSKILDILNLSNDQAGLDNFVEQLRASLMSAKELTLLDAVKGVERLLKFAICYLLQNKKPTDRQNLIQLLSKGFYLQAIIPEHTDSISKIIRNHYGALSLKKKQRFFKALQSDIDASRLAELEKTKAFLMGIEKLETEQYHPIIFTTTSFPKPLIHIVMEFSNPFLSNLKKWTCFDFSQRLPQAEGDPEKQRTLLVLFNRYNPCKKTPMAFVEDNSAEDGGTKKSAESKPKK